jgi:blue copper oxidase
MKRRTVIFGGTALAVAGAGGLVFSRMGSGPLALSKRQRLAMPKMIDASFDGAFALDAGAGQTEFVPGIKSATAGFNQSYLGPVIRVRSGQEVAAAVTNRLAESVAIHWHGLVIPGEVDGGPHQAIPPGDTWRPTLPITQPPATVWYHAHTNRRTAAQVYSGLAGVMLIVDGHDRARGLPTEYGLDDLVLILQDRRFDDAGRMTYDPGMMDGMRGFRGNATLVNGMRDPVARVPAATVRLRLLNGSNARIYDLAFDDGRPMHLIGTDSGMLPQPLALERLRLAPAERAEVLVDFSSGRPAILASGPDRNNGGAGMMALMSGIHDGRSAMAGGSFPILAFQPDPGMPKNITAMPSAVGENATRPGHAPVASRSLTLDMMTGKAGGMMGGNGMMGGMGINGRSFDMQRIDQRIALGNIEKWTIRTSMLSHPFHIHGVRFQVLSENGKPPRAENTGWKDTVLVEDQVELLLEFTQRAARQTLYVSLPHP